MTVAQIYAITNTIAHELIGETAVVNEDLSNIVDIGASFENTVGLDNYVKSLNDHIGRMIFNDRIYKGRVPSVLMDGWEYGSIMEKISPRLPDAAENESWELENGSSYDPNIFTKPDVIEKCFNKRTTFEVPVSITNMQVKSAFSSATQMNAFISMIYTAISNALTLRNDGLIMRTINNFAAMTLKSEYPAAAYAATSGVRAVNLLYLYNQTVTQAEQITTISAAITNPNFIRFASRTIANYTKRIGVMSNLFNIGGESRFTSSDRLHTVFLDDFVASSDIYLQSSTFHDNYTALPTSETVPFWQGSGMSFAFDDISKIDVKTAQNDTVSCTGILGVMFDRDALGVTNFNSRVTSNYNPKGEFWNEWHKTDAGYFNDTNENFIVFFGA